MNLNIPLSNNDKEKLKAGNLVYLTGTIYTARDSAHQRIKELIDNNLPLPFDFKNSIIYYAGPTETKENMIVGSIGPTTSSRMDPYLEMTATLGVSATIGKGERDEMALRLAKENKLIYFVATGGVGALLSKCVTKCEEIAFLDLGCESIKKLEITNFPVFVAYDIKGNDIFRREK